MLWLYRNEAAFKQKCALLLLAIPNSFWVGDNALKVVVLITSLLFVLLLEVINTAIEIVIDRIGM